jgi:nitroreductase
LKRHLTEDVRKKTGTQDFVGTAPLNIVYVADLARAGEENEMWLGADCGFVAENVYLFCASEGLATVVRGLVDRAELARAMELGPRQRILLVQTVGYPAN